MLTLMLEETTIEGAVILPIELHLEHTLVSLSKWESIHKKAFFGREAMSHEETVSYIQQMLIDEIPKSKWANRLTVEHFEAVSDYINSDQTATWFHDEPNSSGPKETVTSELIYYWMISFQIPFEPCQNWHVSRLMTLIKICGVKQAKPKKMSPQAQREYYRKLNEQRRRELGTSG